MSGLERTIAACFGDLRSRERRTLERAPKSPYAAADTAACLLGRDLWCPPLRDYRDDLLRSGERPHLWTFEFGPSGAWDSSRWHALTLPARIVRARAGSLSHAVEREASAWSLGLDSGLFAAGIRDLTARGFAGGGEGAFAPIASESALRVDTALVEILAHWFWMLDHRDRVLADPHATGYEVHGYADVCSSCKERWGLRPRDPQWVPPFHPGCRCFAQPRFTASW